MREGDVEDWVWEEEAPATHASNELLVIPSRSQLQCCLALSICEGKAFDSADSLDSPDYTPREDSGTPTVAHSP